MKIDKILQNKDAALRVLVLGDVIDATQLINFVRPLKRPAQTGEVALLTLNQADLADLPAGPAEIWGAFRPTMFVMSRYSGNQLDAFTALAKRDRVPVVYHIDDDLLAVPESLGAAKHKHYNAPQRTRAMRAAMNAADLIYASTEYLAGRLRTHGIVPPIMCADIACAVSQQEIKPPAFSLRPVIGYMASSGHIKDFELIVPQVQHVLRNNPNLQFEVFGTIAVPAGLAEFGERIRKIAPEMPYEKFLAKLATLGWWAGLAPLGDTPFNRCKTDVKWLEYAAAGIPCIASNIDVYRRACANGAGMLVPDISGWFATINSAVNNPSLRQTLVRNAQRPAGERYTLDRLYRQLRDVFASAANPGAMPVKPKALAAPPPAPVKVPRHPAQAEYEKWIAECDTLSDDDRLRVAAAIKQFVTLPVISVVLFGEGDADIKATMDSMARQLYPHWDLVRSSADQTIVQALKQVKGDYVAFVEAGDTLSETALFTLAVEANSALDAKIFYSDEDEIDAGVRTRPYFKSDWNRELFLGQDFACRLAMMRTEQAKAAATDDIHNGWPGVYALILATLAHLPKAAVRHLPFVLYHRRAGHHVSAEADGQIARATKNFLETAGQPAAEVSPLPGGHRRVRYPLPDPAPLVSAVVATRDRVELLRTCVEGLRSATDYPRLEIIVVDNDSKEPETLAYLDGLKTDPRVRVVRYAKEFNFSAIYNFGAAQAKGEIIALLNNDLKIMEPDWLREMVSHAIRPDIGAVGAMLYYEDGRVQHAGVVLGIGGVASHIFKKFAPDEAGHGWRMQLTQELSAVTAACMVMRREVWDRVNGLDETFVVAYNDIDLCLRIREAGYRIIWTPFARLYHLESASRGLEDNPEKRARLDAEKARMVARWGERLTNDPFYNPNLSLKSIECRLAFPPRVTPPWRS